MTKLVYIDSQTWIDTIWDALHTYREFNLPEGDKGHDKQWDDICTAMAWIEEDMGFVEED